MLLHNADNKLLFTPMFPLPFYAHFFLNQMLLSGTKVRFYLPQYNYKLYKESLVNRCLFCECY